MQSKGEGHIVSGKRQARGLREVEAYLGEMAAVVGGRVGGHIISWFWDSTGLRSGHGTEQKGPLQFTL